MAIPSGVILVWPSTNATIPSGWERETTLDGKYPKGHGSENPNVTGGSNTHTHSDTHTHTAVSHTHSVSLDSVSGDGTAYCWIDPDTVSGGGAGHDHDAVTSSSSSGGGLTGNSTWASANSEPPYYCVIFIKPSGAAAAIRTGISAYYNGSSAPENWHYCDGTSGTPDLRNKYLKGAATGADSGTTGGSTTHSHDIGHTHTVSAHSHAAFNSDIYRETYLSRGSGSTGPTAARANHYHSISLSNATSSISASTGTGGGETTEIAYKKLGLIQCINPSIKKGIVGLWLGTVANIPNNWSVCDGTNGTLDLRDKFIKIGASLANNNETGGSNTHSHTAVSHNHSVSASHSHTGSHGGPSENRQLSTDRNQEGYISTTHTHGITCSSVSETFNATNISADTVDFQPAYRTVAYIQLTRVYNGMPLLNFI